MFWFKSKAAEIRKLEAEVDGRNMKIEELEARLASETRVAVALSDKLDKAEGMTEMFRSLQGELREDCWVACQATKRIMDAWIRDHDRLVVRIEELTPPPPTAQSLAARGRVRGENGRFIPTGKTEAIFDVDLSSPTYGQVLQIREIK